jgi:hypothetical protein
MNTNVKKNLPDSLARVFSVIFHPLIMPLYGLAIILSAPTLFGYLPFDVKKLLFFIVVINNVLLPLSLLPFFINRKIVTSWTISERKERIIPLILATVLYATTSYIIFKFPIPFFLKSFIFSLFFLSLIVTIVNFWWKISLHSVAAGALISIVLILSFKMYTPLIIYQISVIVAAGLVLSSRLRLNYHNPQQVWIGLLTGFMGLTISMILLQ